jgi:cytosine/creatinine deaminase
LDISSRSWVIKRGKITVVTHHSCEIHRPGLALRNDH